MFLYGIYVLCKSEEAEPGSFPGQGERVGSGDNPLYSLLLLSTVRASKD